jgi:hypothetical protein
MKKEGRKRKEEKKKKKEKKICSNFSITIIINVEKGV